MAQKGLNIYKRKDGRWEGRCPKILPTGERKYEYIYGKSYKQVRELLLKKLTCDQTAIAVLQPDTFRTAAYEWIESVGLHIKDSSKSLYLRTLEKHLLPVIGEKRISEVDYTTLGQLAAYLRTDGYSPKTIQEVLGVARRVIRFAGVEPPSTTVRQIDREMRVLSISEQFTFTDYLMNDTDLFKFGTLLCLYTGLRIGELCGLRWEDINIHEGTLRVNRTVQRICNPSGASPRTSIIITEPKTRRSRRIIPLPSYLVYIAKQFQAPETAYILTGTNNCAEPRMMQYYFKRYTNDCKLEDVTFHTLRHSFASRCIEAGFDVKSLSEILGHANVNITLNRYVHSSFDQKRQNMDKLPILCSPPSE